MFWVENLIRCFLKTESERKISAIWQRKRRKDELSFNEISDKTKKRRRKMLHDLKLFVCLNVISRKASKRNLLLMAVYSVICQRHFRV